MSDESPTRENGGTTTKRPHGHAATRRSRAGAWRYEDKARLARSGRGAGAVRGRSGGGAGAEPARRKGGYEDKARGEGEAAEL